MVFALGMVHCCLNGLVGGVCLKRVFLLGTVLVQGNSQVAVSKLCVESAGDSIQGMGTYIVRTRNPVPFSCLLRLSLSSYPALLLLN